MANMSILQDQIGSILESMVKASVAEMSTIVDGCVASKSEVDTAEDNTNSPNEKV